MENNSSDDFRILHSELFDVWYSDANKTKCIDVLVKYVLNQMKSDNLNIEPNNLTEKIRLFCKNVLQRWRNSSRTLNRFKRKNSKWLSEYFELKLDSVTKSSVVKVGRPVLPYNEKSARSRRRDARKLATENDNPKLVVEAASMVARTSGQFDLAKVLKEVNKSPSRPSKFRKLIRETKQELKPLSTTEALAFILDNNLSKAQYSNIRMTSKDHYADIYPAYNKILEAKSLCRPDGVVITDTTAKVSLKSLLQHTTKRIAELQKEILIHVLQKCNVDKIESTMIFSYGFDGSTGHSLYKQKYCSENVPTSLDSSLFATTVIPLRLVEKNTGAILWNNQTPQSIRFCRPLKLEFVKENREHIIKEKQRLDSDIENLAEYVIEITENKFLKITFNLNMTLIDGKVLNILTNTKSCQTCPLCGSTPLQIKNIKKIDSASFKVKNDVWKYGISPLHSWIRLFECIIHISYRLTLKIWQIRGDRNKEEVKKRKLEIQKKFWEKMHLHVDKPKDGGSGSTNDGNTARREFANPQLFSEITGVDYQLIQNFRIILISLSCQYSLNLNMFGNFCTNTFELYHHLYDWYPMPATVHKILVHGKHIVENSILPTGFLGEDASESRNKLYRKDREEHARKDSRMNNLADMFNRALDSSDPIISSISLKSRLKSKHTRILPHEVLQMLDVEVRQQNEITRTQAQSLSDDDELENDDNDTFEEDVFQFHGLSTLELDSLNEDL